MRSLAAGTRGSCKDLHPGACNAPAPPASTDHARHPPARPAARLAPRSPAPCPRDGRALVFCTDLRRRCRRHRALWPDRCPCAADRTGCPRRSRKPSVAPPSCWSSSPPKAAPAARPPMSCSPSSRSGLVEDTPVIALELHVDYWNYLGWRDPFSDEAYSQRQSAYVPLLGMRGPYTPQLVVNGRFDVLGSSSSRARAAILNASETQTSRSKLSLKLNPQGRARPCTSRPASSPSASRALRRDHRERPADARNTWRKRRPRPAAWPGGALAASRHRRRSRHPLRRRPPPPVPSWRKKRCSLSPSRRDRHRPHPRRHRPPLPPHSRQPLSPRLHIELQTPQT